MIHKYEEADKYVIYNDKDKNLNPVVLKLPAPPDYKLIDGYGVKPIDQYWKPLAVPNKLLLLQEQATSKVRDWSERRQDRRVTEYRVANMFWKILDESKSYYKDEIAYINKIHYHLYWGYWFFNLGVPTWIPPTYFRYINFWYIPDDSLPGHRPFYRDVDRRTYIWKWYCRTTKETFGNLDEEGFAQKDRYGRYEIIEKSHRTCFGHQKPKRRREGASNQECSDMLWTAERTLKGDSVIMADKGQSARDIFEQIMLPGFIHQPLFLKPINEAYPNSSKIEMVAPNYEYGIESLGSVISYMETADEGAVDRMKLYNILSDESAKLLRADARRRHHVSKLTTTQFSDIHGYMSYPSTVEEMNEGGEAYRALWDESDFYRRNPQGQTLSGLYRIFWPSWDGLDGYIDKWGRSVIDDPTEEQIKYPPLKADYLDGVGAKEMLMSTVNQMLNEGTPEALRSYREFVRKFPLESSHCWIGTSGDMGWNIINIDKQLAKLDKNNSDIVRGDFEWIDGVEFSPKGVRFVENKLTGRFYVSDLNEGRENLWTMTPGPVVWDEKLGRYVRAKMPLHPNFYTVGADSFDYGTAAEARGRASGTRKSDGGIHVLRNYDPLIDGGKTKKEWGTYKTVLTYRYRPASMEEYAKDVVKVMVFYGGMLSLERNKTGLWENIIDWGYGGHLIYMINADGSMEKKPGVWTGQGHGGKDHLFDLAGDYIDFRIEYEVHTDLLNEMKNIPGPEKLKDYDLLTAFMCSLVGEERGHQKRLIRTNAPEHISLKGTSFAPHRIG